MRVLQPPITSHRSPERRRPSETVGGDRFLPDEGGYDTLFSAYVDAALEDGAVVCKRLVVSPGTQPVTLRTLSQIDPRWLSHLLLAQHGMIPGERVVYEPDSDDETWEAHGTGQRRRSVDSIRLFEVARAYRSGKAAAVMRDCYVSESQAYRLIRRARDAGILGERGEEHAEHNEEEQS